MHRTLTHAALLLILALPFLASSPGTRAQPTPSDGRPDQVVLLPSAGIGLAAATSYLSPPTEAARPFTHMLLRREAHVPEGAELTLEVPPGDSVARAHALGEEVRHRLFHHVESLAGVIVHLDPAGDAAAHRETSHHES